MGNNRGMRCSDEGGTHQCMFRCMRWQMGRGGKLDMCCGTAKGGEPRCQVMTSYAMTVGDMIAIARANSRDSVETLEDNSSALVEMSRPTHRAFLSRHLGDALDRRHMCAAEFPCSGHSQESCYRRHSSAVRRNRSEIGRDRAQRDLDRCRPFLGEAAASVSGYVYICREHLDLLQNPPLAVSASAARHPSTRAEYLAPITNTAVELRNAMEKRAHKLRSLRFPRVQVWHSAPLPHCEDSVGDDLWRKMGRLLAKRFLPSEEPDPGADGIPEVILDLVGHDKDKLRRAVTDADTNMAVLKKMVRTWMKHI